MKCVIVVLALAFLQDIPFKVKEEFEVKLDYQFKQRPAADPNTVRLGESSQTYTQRASNSGVLPYLILNIKMLALREEKMRVTVTTNRNDRPVLKKVNPNSVLQLDLGFTHDMVDRVNAHEYTLTFFDSQKNPVERILITVEEDGSFMVNGEKRGKF